MADSTYMGTTPLMGVTAGWCKIKTPDTGNPNAKNPAFRNKAPQWKAEIIIDRERDAAFLSAVRQHVAREAGTAYDAGDEPWVKTKGEHTKEDGTIYPAYEYIDTMTKTDPHERGRIVDKNKEPFTDEVYKGSTINVVINPQYTTIHKYMMTFYLDAIQVMEQTSGNSDPMSYFSTPDFSEAASDAPAEDVMAAFD